MEQPSTAAATSAVSSRIDRVISQLLIGANRSEVDLGRFAAQYSQNNNVKSYAEKVVKDHTDFIKKLQQASGVGVVSQAEAAGQMQPAMPGQRTFAQPGAPRTGQVEGARPYGTTPQSRIAGYPPSGAAVPSDIVQMTEQARTQRDAMLRNELERSKGANFDKAYVGQQLMANIDMLATLRAFDSHAASPQLKQVINEGIQATQQRLDETRNLMAQLEESGQKK
jgi:predicted outer membrane protein